MDMQGLQLVFENGVETPLFESEDAVENELVTIEVDTSQDIRYVSMKV